MNGIVQRRVLCLTYEFPPMGGGAVARIHAFVKYLPRFGYLPRVLTVDMIWHNTAITDDSLTAQYTLGVTVSRTPSLMPAGRIATAVKADVLGTRKTPLPFSGVIKSVLRLVYRGLVIPEESILWLPYAIKAGRALAAQCDVILATTPPHGVGVIAALLSRLTNVPLVLDVRDDWIGNPLWTLSGLRLQVDKLLEKFAINTAKTVIAVTPESQRLIQEKYPERDPKFCQVIPNGFDPDVLSTTELGDNQLPPRRGRVRIVYAGILPRKRSPSAFLSALRILSGEYVNLDEELEVIFIGSLRREFQDEIAETPCASYLGAWSQRDTVRLLQSADVGLVIIPYDEGSRTAIPGKVYEYMAAGLYLLVLADSDSAAGRLVNDLKLGAVVPQNNVDDLAISLRQILDRSAIQSIRPQVDDAILNRFSRIEHSRRLSEILNQVCGK